MPVEVDVLARAESVAMLQARVPALAETDADRLAAALGDLPLAVAQAAGYLPGSGLSAAAYLELLGTRAAPVLDLGKPVSYPRSLAAATGLSVDQLAGEDPAAGQLVSVCAFLAPEPIPQDLFTTTAAELPEPLAGRAGPAGVAAAAGPARHPVAGPGRPGWAADAPAHPGHRA